MAFLRLFTIVTLGLSLDHCLPERPTKIEGRVLGPDGQGFGRAVVVLIDSASGHPVDDPYISPDGDFIFGVKKHRTFLLIAAEEADTLSPDTIVVHVKRDAENQVLQLSYPVPAVKIATPTNSSTVWGSVDVEVHLSNNVRSVQYWVDAGLIETDENLAENTSHFKWQTWREVDGEHRLAVKASDAHGQTAQDSVQVDIDNTGIWAGMVFIPAGRFLRGKESGPSDATARSVFLSAFYIDRFEVTNDLYKKFVEDQGMPEPQFWSDTGFNDPGSPVVGIGWDEARRFCEWAGKRLPTEAEWERVAKGIEGYDYPWGDMEPTLEKANYGNSIGHPVIGDRFPSWGSWGGQFNMAGNVYEWVGDIYDPEYYQTGPDQDPKGPSPPINGVVLHVVRGGSWKSEPIRLQTYRRSYLNSDDEKEGNNFTGFRCARDGE